MSISLKVDDTCTSTKSTRSKVEGAREGGEAGAVGRPGQSSDERSPDRRKPDTEWPVDSPRWHLTTLYRRHRGVTGTSESRILIFQRVMLASIQPRVNRRALVRTGAAALVAGVAGCLGRRERGRDVATDEDRAAGVRWDRRYARGAVTGFSGVVTMRDGGFVAVGHATVRPELPSTGLVVRTDGAGVERWRRTLLGVGVLLDAVETPDGGVVAVGESGGWRSSRGSRAVRLAGDGTVRWARGFVDGGPSDLWTVARRSSGGYLVGGGRGRPHTGQSAWLAALDEEGTPVWDVRSPFPETEAVVRDVAVRPERVVVTGTAGPANLPGGLVAEVAHEGTVRWVRRIDFESVRVVESGDGHVLLGVEYGDTSNPVLAKVDAGGDAVWRRSYVPAEETQWFWPFDLAASTDGGFLLLGRYEPRERPDGSRSRLVVVGVSDDGTAVEWARTYGADGRPQSATITAVPGGDFVVATGARDGSRGRLLRADVPATSNVTVRVVDSGGGTQRSHVA